MAGLTPAVPSDDDNIPLSAQVTSFKLRDEFKGTVADVLALAIGEAEPVFTDVDETPATAPYICDYNILALACKTICLKDPLDVESGAPVEKDGTFINGVQVRTDGDPMKGGVDLEAPVSQVAGGVSVWCFTFSAEADKGNNIIVKE